MSRLRAAAFALGLLGAAHAADAQALRLHDASDPPAVAACLAAIPASAFTRVLVHVAAEPVDSVAHAALRPAADLLAQGIAQRMRATVAAASSSADDGVPAADELLAWRDVPAEVDVIVRRGGGMALAAPEVRDDDAGRGIAPDTAGVALLMRAVGAAIADGDRVAWPDGLDGDSAQVTLRLAGPTIRRDGSTTLDGVRRATPAFTLALPWAEPVAMTVAPRIAYPEVTLRGGAEGFVILRYVVDETGRTKQGSVEEQWPVTRPRLRGDVGRFYAAFVRSAERGVHGARFEPARIGGCAVPYLVQQSFAYGFRR